VVNTSQMDRSERNQKISLGFKKRVLVIIPAYNEERSIGKVIGEVKHVLPQSDVLVVNDGSSDCTSEKAEASGAIVLDLPFNLGIGGALQAGYQYTYEKGYDIAIQVDSDGQHDPKEMDIKFRSRSRNQSRTRN